MPEDQSPPIYADRPIPVDNILPIATSMAKVLAIRHAEGKFGGLTNIRADEDGNIIFGEPEKGHPTQDVRDLMRMVIDLGVPDLPAISDEHLLSHLSQLIPELPIDIIPIIADSLARSHARRPQDGLELWVRLAHANVHTSLRQTAPLPEQVRWEIGYDSHIGRAKARLGQTNQDAFFYRVHDKTALMVVADGISIATVGSGNLASAILVQVITNMWDRHHTNLLDGDSEKIHAFLNDTLALANNTICNGSSQLAGESLTHHLPMGTTVVMPVAHGPIVHIASLGDSRAYLVSSNGASLLTGDQNLRGTWLQSFLTDEPMALEHDGNALVGYAGHFDSTGMPTPQPPAITTVRMLPGEQLILCSDGLTDYAAPTHARISSLLKGSLNETDTHLACRKLVESANEGGGGDNITVLLARPITGQVPSNG